MPRPRPARRPASRGTASVPLPARAAALVRSLPDRALIDRLVRGRAWIPVLGLMLAGIVFMQVELLKLSSAIGHSIDRGATLQSQNEQLRASVATLADDQRLERLAAGLGMVMPSPDSVVFLAPEPGVDALKAIAKMRAPDQSAISAVQAATTPSGQTNPGTGSSSSASGSSGPSGSSGSTGSSSSSVSSGSSGSSGGSGSSSASTTSGGSAALAQASAQQQSSSSSATGN